MLSILVILSNPIGNMPQLRWWRPPAWRAERDCYKKGGRDYTFVEGWPEQHWAEDISTRHAGQSFRSERDMVRRGKHQELIEVVRIVHERDTSVETEGLVKGGLEYSQQFAAQLIHFWRVNLQHKFRHKVRTHISWLYGPQTANQGIPAVYNCSGESGACMEMHIWI